MRAREEVISTYLGNGIALPHCTYEDRGLIKRTALVMAQYPAASPGAMTMTGPFWCSVWRRWARSTWP